MIKCEEKKWMLYFVLPKQWVKQACYSRVSTRTNLCVKKESDYQGS